LPWQPCGADTLAGEINSGTIQTIVTKPIRRSDIVLGKWLGFAGLLGLYLLLIAGGIVLSVFVQTGYAPDNLVRGLSLIYLEALVVMTITLLCSSAFPALATGGGSFLVCMVSRSSAAGSSNLVCYLKIKLP
jgi:ABC-type transport system involved in multi-copper enzyme maturation permease subunit